MQTRPPLSGVRAAGACRCDRSRGTIRSVSEQALSHREVERLRAADLTYAEVGATRGETMPSGYPVLRRSARLGDGRARFEQAACALLGWDLQRRAGLRVRTSDPRARLGTVALLRLGVGVVSLEAPVRVVYAVDEPRRRGFAYGTLAGHPEQGEEAFLIELDDHDAVTLTIAAFSRPATLLARVSGPAGRAIQSWMTHRYLRAL